ncbi:hypothetical protein OROGR_002854 [Orobanche gracilis]
MRRSLSSASGAVLLIQTLFILFLLLKEAKCSSSRVQFQLYEFQRKLHQHKTSFSSFPAPTPKMPPSYNTCEFSLSPKSNGRVFYPIGYGADPSGGHDSASAIYDALLDAAKHGKRPDFFLLPGITDLGGVIIDLQGGDFRVDRPIRFPPGIGNIVVQGGTLRASAKFPGDRHLIELWAPDSTTTRKHSNTKTTGDIFSNRKDRNNDGMKYEDITFRDILFDSGFRGGGLLVIDSIRIRIVDCFFIRFTTQGIMVKRGHETFVSGCFLGQHLTDGGDPDEKHYTGAGIDIASTDNAITDVAVFSARIGIVLRGNANVVTGVHCYNKANGFGGVGILVQSAQNRITNPYLDFNSIVIEDPHQVHVSGGFFIGGGNIVLKSSIMGRISGLNIINNMFTGGMDDSVPSVVLKGSFGSIDQVVVDQNVVDGMRLKSTVAKLRALPVGMNGTRWKADFSSILLFPDKINHVEYSFFVRGGGDGGFPDTHAVTNVSSNVVVIESQRAVSAVVSVSVDQYNLIGEEKL